MSIDGNYCAMCKKLITDCTCPVIVNRVDFGEYEALQAENTKLKELVREAIKEWGRIDIYKTWGRKAKQLIGDKSGGTDGS